MNERGRILTSVSMVHALTDGSIAVVSILFPIFKEMFNLSYTQVGLITGGGLFITLVMQLVLGRMADGKNVNSFLLTGVLLTSLSMVLLSVSQSFITLILFIFVLRFATSFFHPIGIGWISRTYKKNKLDWAMGIQSGSADIGGFLAIATTLYLTGLWNWTIPLYIWAVAGICGLFIGIILTYRIDKRWMVVTTTRKKQTFNDALIDAFRCMKKIKILLPAFMISGASWGVMITYLPLLLNARTTLSLPVIGLLVAVWTGIGSIASLSYGKIRTQINRKNVLVLSYIAIGILGILLTIFTQTFVLLAIMVLSGISMFLTYPALFSFVSEVTAESKEGWTFGITFTFQTGAGTLILLLGGFLSDIYGIWMPFALLGVLSLLLVVFLLTQYKKPFAC